MSCNVLVLGYNRQTSRPYFPNVKHYRCKGTTFFAHTQEKEQESDKFLNFERLLLHFASKIGWNKQEWGDWSV